MPSITGTANRNIIVVPCMVKIWLYWSGPRNVLSGMRELQPHQQRFDAADQQEDECGDDVAHPDRLVRGHGKPAEQARRVPPCSLERVAACSTSMSRDLRERRHCRLSRYSISGCMSSDFSGDRRHVIPGLDVLRIGDPACEVSFVVRQRSGRDRDAAAEMRQIRRDLPGGRRPAECVAEHAGVVEKYLLAALLQVVGRVRPPAELLLHPRFESGPASATTHSAMCACCSPQNSAHCPRKRPGWSAWIHSR